MAAQVETLQVTGIRCERCVNRLAAALRGHEGLESANANLMGQVSLSYDDEVTSRETLVAAREHDLNPLVAVYLNRLSDLLFVLARAAPLDNQYSVFGRVVGGSENSGPEQERLNAVRF